MASTENSKAPIERSASVAPAAKGAPRSLAIAETGIGNSHQFAAFMSALMADLVSGRVAPQIGNAAANAGGKMLKVVEMQMKYGTASPDGTAGKVLQLVPPAPEG